MSNLVTVLRNNTTIGAKVAEIIAGLQKSHTRSEAFRAINEAHIKDKTGKDIIPSVWYHAVCYNIKANGKTIMNELYPDFVPTESPYPRVKSSEKENVAPELVLRQLLKKMNDMVSEIENALPKDNAIHASIRNERFRTG